MRSFVPNLSMWAVHHVLRPWGIGVFHIVGGGRRREGFSYGEPQPPLTFAQQALRRRNRAACRVRAPARDSRADKRPWYEPPGAPGAAFAPLRLGRHSWRASMPLAPWREFVESRDSRYPPRA